MSVRDLVKLAGTGLLAAAIIAAWRRNRWPFYELLDPNPK